MARATSHLIAGGFALALTGFAAAPSLAGEGAHALPSGHTAELSEVIWSGAEEGAPMVRFRFLDAELPARVKKNGFVDAEEDMAHLCATVALPAIKQSGAAPEQVIISIADRYLPLGEADPEVVQLFEAYSVAGGSCEWEGF